MSQLDESAVEHGGRSRRRAPGADPEVRTFGTERTCAAPGCGTRLSRYNPDVYCSVHRGWDRRVVTRQRRNGSRNGNGAAADEGDAITAAG